jgi:hypothetical protein
MELNLTLNVEEVSAILQTLGNLPTSSGAFPLLMKIKQQADPQVDLHAQAQLPQEEPTE